MRSSPEIPISQHILGEEHEEQFAFRHVQRCTVLGTNVAMESQNEGETPDQTGVSCRRGMETPFNLCLQDR